MTNNDSVLMKVIVLLNAHVMKRIFCAKVSADAQTIVLENLLVVHAWAMA